MLKMKLFDNIRVDLNDNKDGFKIDYTLNNETVLFHVEGSAGETLQKWDIKMSDSDQLVSSIALPPQST